MSLAADLPVKAPVYKAPVAIPFTWTGFYVGANAGYGWVTSSDVITRANAAAAGWLIPQEIASPLSFNPSGFVGGVQAGYNWQVAPHWVIGAETDIAWTDFDKTTVATGTVDTTRIMTAHEKLDWLGTLRGRVGFTPANRFLAYVTGGLAYGHATLSTALTRQGDPSTPPNGCGGFDNCQSGSVSDTKIGWTIGGGVEWAFESNWSVKAEYLYFDLGSISHLMTDPVFAPVYNASADLKGSIVRAGLNYHF